MTRKFVAHSWGFGTHADVRRPRQILTGTQAVDRTSAMSTSSVAATLAAMFPLDVGPLIDVSGKRYAHTVSNTHRLIVTPTALI